MCLISLIVVVVVVVGFIHCDLKHEYFYVDYSIEWLLIECMLKIIREEILMHVIKQLTMYFKVMS